MYFNFGRFVLPHLKQTAVFITYWCIFTVLFSIFADFTYLIIGVTLGAFLAIGFIAVIICMIKKQMLDNVFGGKRKYSRFLIQRLKSPCVSCCLQ